ncbi:TetR/AcrR family transcriptional regulator [Nocardia jejuensis]|uniref:TetR/AcrR family transcriptional regulator n=1 Tax=Nocardia jejuensis TaxID=328049 RepID=UPI00082CE23D|nr:TetR/AcrR family transcriptional regulator [Nocardia jejuensis]
MGRPRNFEADDVVERAMDAFWTHGYANTSPADLAAATGIGKGSLYNTFGSKRQLFDQAFAHYSVRGAELAREFLAEPGGTRERVRDFLRMLVDTDLAQPIRRGCMAVNTAVEFAGQDPDIDRAILEATEGVIAALADRIEQGRRDGDIRADIDPRVYAEYLMTTIGGLRIMAKTFDAATLHRVIDTTVSTL